MTHTPIRNSWAPLLGAIGLALLPSLASAQDNTNLVGYWPANEGSGTTVANIHNADTNGTLNNGSWSADGGGHTGLDGDYAFELKGAPDSNVEVPQTNVAFDEITITAWIKGIPAGAWTGIVYARSAQAIGLDFHNSTGNITYTWNDNSGETWGFNSELNVPENEWTFVAMSLKADGNTLYVGTTGANGELNSNVNEIDHVQQINDQAPFHFGVDLCCGNGRNFEGSMDDIAIWDVALTPEQIESLWNGSATPPSVFDNSDPGLVVGLTQDFGRLPFVPGAQELAFDIRNSGESEELTIGSEITAGGENFTLVSAPESLAPGTAGKITIEFDPKNGTGQFLGTLQLTTNDPDEEDKVVPIELRASLVDPSGPVGCYPLDDPNGTVELVDITGNGRFGTIHSEQGNAKWEEEALASGTALRVSGGSHVSVPAGLAGLESFATSLWINTTPTPFSVLFANGSEITPGVAVLISEGKDLQWFFDSAPVAGTTSAPLSPNTTHHLVISYDANADGGPTTTFYVDGAEVLNESIDRLDLSDTANILTFGGIAGNAGLALNGVMDDIQLYDRPLSADEVGRLFGTPGSKLTSTEDPDSDLDGLTDEEEIALGTDPLSDDTDGDGLKDGAEVSDHETDPLQVDTDGDGDHDLAELHFGGNPTDEAITLGTFLVRNVTAAPGVVFDSMDAFKEALENPAALDLEVTETAGVINYVDSGGDANFGDGAPFPVYGERGNHDDFGIHVTGKFTIAEEGPRSFGVNSDDGFQLFIDGELAFEFPDPRGPADTIETVNLTAGEHALELFFYERGGGAEVELFVNADLGAVETFDEGNFLLLPATGSGDADTDGDGLPDFWERRFFGDDTSAEPAGDPDEDGLDNAGELAEGSLPNNADTDGDTLKDGDELAASPPTSPVRSDTDEDGLADNEEETHGTDPTKPDTDGDTLTDGSEVGRGTDPLDPNDPAEILATAYIVPKDTVGNQAFGGSLGHDFIVQNAIVVNELGVFDDGSDGLNSELTAVLWTRDDNGTPDDVGDDGPGDPIATIEFTPEDQGVLVNGSRFKPLAKPIRLEPGAYTMIAFGYGAGDNNGNQGSVDLGTTTDAGGSALKFIGGGRWVADPGAWPSNVDGGPEDRYAAGTFTFAVERTVDPNADSDKDGVTDGDEALAGTDPNDASDYFRVVGTTRADEITTLTWPSAAGVSYVVEFSETLEGEWQVVSEAPIPGTGEPLSFEATNGTPAGYYRLRTAP